uniref:Uncharacterized protein MANES_14G058600 n=1 Tax=Rhizophora mucronata TaxID=61149 RepID=A0A2P2LEA8_RHIMU
MVCWKRIRVCWIRCARRTRRSLRSLTRRLLMPKRTWVKVKFEKPIWLNPYSISGLVTRKKHWNSSR